MWVKRKGGKSLQININGKSSSDFYQLLKENQQYITAVNLLYSESERKLARANKRIEGKHVNNDMCSR